MEFEIIYMRADYEPWWQFEGWEQAIQARYQFDDEEAYLDGLQQLLQRMQASYPNMRLKNELFIAFWDENETEFCESCDEDTQIYHGLVLSVPIHENVRINR